MSDEAPIDTPNYPEASVDLGQGIGAGFLTFVVDYNDGEFSDAPAGTVPRIGSHCCCAELTDEQAAQVHAALGRYLADRAQIAGQSLSAAVFEDSGEARTASDE